MRDLVPNEKYPWGTDQGSDRALESREFFNYWLARRGVQGSRQIADMDDESIMSFHRQATEPRRQWDLFDIFEEKSKIEAALLTIVKNKDTDTADLRQEKTLLNREVSGLSTRLDTAHQTISTYALDYDLAKTENSTVCSENTVLKSQATALKADLERARNDRAAEKKLMFKQRLEIEEERRNLRDDRDRAEKLCKTQDLELGGLRRQKRVYGEKFRSLKRTVDEMEDADE